MAIALLAILGLGSGISAIADGFYDLTVWGPITVAMLALALAAAAVAPGRPRLVPALAVGGLVALWAWSWLSASWAESADQALVDHGALGAVRGDARRAAAADADAAGPLAAARLRHRRGHGRRWLRAAAHAGG